MDIILEYKEEFERIELNHKKIDNCIFEEIDKELFEEIFDKEDYASNMHKLEKKYYLNNMTVGEFQSYYIQEQYIQKVTFKFSLMGQTDDFFQTNIKRISSDFMKDIKIKYIYKLNTFELCLFLGTYEEDNLEELYQYIASDVYEYPRQVEVIRISR